MSPRLSHPVAILGGGFAGLVAASVLSDAGIAFRVLEGSPKVGGLAGSLNRSPQLAHDFGAHFITNRLAMELGLSQQCRRLRRYGECVYLAGRWHSFPYGLLRLPGAARDLVATALRGNGDGEPGSAADVLRRRYGAAVADRVGLPLLRAWSGVDPDALAPAAVDNLPNSLLLTAALHGLRVISGIPIALGYSREQPVHAGIWHVYPKSGGIGAISSMLASRVAQNISLASPITQIRRTAGICSVVETGGQSMEVAGVINTLPVTVLPRVCEEIEEFQTLSRLKYRKLVIINVLMKGTAHLPNVVCWFPESRYPFFRITESTQATPWTVMPGLSVLTIDFGVDDDDPWWKAPDAMWESRCVDALVDLHPRFAASCIEFSVSRVALGYPLFLRSYEPLRVDLPRRLSQHGFCSIGRNGEFEHILMEDVYWRTRSRVTKFMAELASLHRI